MKLLADEKWTMPIPFMLFPDFTIVFKYLEFDDPLAVFQHRTNQEYYVYNDDYHTDAEVGRIEREFRAIIGKLGIVHHYDNMLLIILENLNKMDKAIDALRKQLTQENRIKEISNFLLAFRNGNDFQITVKEKINGKSKPPVVILDQVLLNWIAGIIDNAIKSGIPPQLDLFGLLPSKLSLKAASRLKINTVEPKINIYQTRLITELALDLCDYLNDETILKKAALDEFSDLQRNFIYEILTLFKLINEKIFPYKDYQPKDYVSSLFTNFKKITKREIINSKI